MSPHIETPPDQSAHGAPPHSDPTRAVAARAALRLEGTRIIMPGMATAHSHAFQRLLRGRTQRRADAAGTFWSWRGLMYALAEQLDPAGMGAVARLAFAELAISGVTAVGEFHYLHHAPGGKPYADRLEMSHAVIHAAREAGLRITLIRTAYMRGGFGQPLTPAQARFADADVAAVINDVEQLRKAYAHDPTVAVGVAAHSIRAVPIDAVVTLADYARDNGLPFHMHVAEQPRELAECRGEYGTTPVHLLADHGVVDANLVAVHATHLDDGEIAQLGRAGSTVCICRSTERDLGDGLPPVGPLVAAGARICVGVDSHCSSDAFEEIRAVELDERSRTQQRHAAMDGAALLTAATSNGYAAIGQALNQGDAVALARMDPALVGASTANLTDAVIFGAVLRAVERVTVNGRTIVEQGRHRDQAAIVEDFHSALARFVP